MTDIDFYTKYQSDGDSDIDLDELIRENERIRKRLSLLTAVEIRKIRWKKKKYSRSQTRESTSSTKKREYRPLVRRIGPRNLNQFLRVPEKPTEVVPQSFETFNGFEDRQLGEYGEANPSRIIPHVLRPISLRHVKLDGAASRSNFEEKSSVRYSREHSREDANQEWHRQNSVETDEEEDGLKSPVAVSDLVSKFERVRRSNAFSSGKTKTTFDPYSSLERKASREREETQRRSIRVILHNSPPVLDQTNSRSIDGYSRQIHVTPHEVQKIPQRTLENIYVQQTSNVSKSNFPLLRMKSEGHSQVYPANLSGLSTTDQVSLSPSSESRSLKKGYSFDSGSRTQKPVYHPPVTYDQLGPPTDTTFNHISVVSQLPRTPPDGVNIRRAHSASKGDELLRHRNSSRSSVDKNPDVKRRITFSIVEEKDAVPSWKSEVEMRKKTKSYVSAHKPEQPMQLGSTPEWKRLLLEKNKQKRNSAEYQQDHFNTRITKPDANINFTEPAWKQEFDKIRRQVVTHHQNNHHAAQHVIEREIPEWVKLAEQRSRSNFISENDDPYAQ